MTKHTEGPWTHERMFLSEGVKDRRSGWVVNGPNEKNEFPTRICDMRTHSGKDYPTTEANAALIASAPEMLEALQGLMDAFIHTEGNKRGNQAKTDIIKYNQPHVSGALNRARHAIAKAEGTK